MEESLITLNYAFKAQQIEKTKNLVKLPTHSITYYKHKINQLERELKLLRMKSTSLEKRSKKVSINLIKINCKYSRSRERQVDRWKKLFSQENNSRISQLTFETFNRCLRSHLNKSEYSSYRNDPGFMNAIQSALSNKPPRSLEQVKKVSFSTLPEKPKRKKNCNTTKSTTVKSSSSKGQPASDQLDDLNFEDFNKFYQLFVDNYAELGEGSLKDLESQKIVQFMSNRENESEQDYDTESQGTENKAL